ncbi:hypothetical protein [Ligilactobacillus equi]|nr:hypothetical protein [Ligilactobacillus equi]
MMSIMLSSDFKFDEAVADVQKKISMFPAITDTLTKFDTDSLQFLSTEALKQAGMDGFNDDNVIMPAALLVAHYCALSADTSGNIQEQTADVLTQKFFDRNGSDNFLVEYKRLKKSISRGVIRFL